MPDNIVTTFDLTSVDDTGEHAILEVLRIDRENILAFDLDKDRRLLRVETATAGTAAHINAFIAHVSARRQFMARKIIRRNDVTKPTFHDIDSAIASSPDMDVLGNGLTALSGKLLALFRFFERQFLSFSRQFDAKENHYPVIVPRKILEDLRYFENFPSQVTFCSHLRGSLPQLEAIAYTARKNPEALSENYELNFADPDYVLTPAVCLPCYRQQSGVVIPQGTVRALTMQNHVFRYEGGNFRPLTRAWDFTVRDIVFFGAAKDLERLRNEVMDWTVELCRKLDLQVTIEVANDPFFLNASRDKVVYQRMGEVKYELLFELPYRKEFLAASSFNLHREFYTSIYNTRLENGMTAESACMGFGIERYVYGFLSQKGMDPANWPAFATSELNG